MIKKIVLVILILVALIGGSLLYSYYSLLEYTLNTEDGTLTRNGVVYKPSDELFRRYQNNEIAPSEKPIGRLKGDSPFGLKTFIYKFDGVSEKEGFMATSPFMNIDFYEIANK